MQAPSLTGLPPKFNHFMKTGQSVPQCFSFIILTKDDYLYVNPKLNQNE